MAKGTKITTKQAQKFFKVDLAKAERVVSAILGKSGHQFSQGEYNALVDLVFNAGSGILSSKSSPHLMGDIMAGNYGGMSGQLRYTRARNGAHLPGLITRSNERRAIDLGANP